MGNSVTFKQLVKKHPNKFVIAVVSTRDAETKRANSFQILQTVDDVTEMELVMEYYQQEEFEGVVAIPTFTSEDTPDLPAKYAALLFRTLYFEEEE